MKFVDFAKISVKSGDGGKGHISFRREKYVPKGGPDGGNGGKGGDIIFAADPHMNTLLDFKYKRHYKAEDGEPGGKNRCTGADGEELIIRVPIGTIIKNYETDEILSDIIEPEIHYIIAKGGKGGRGNSEFATPTNQAPRFAEEGEPGTEIEILLELKIIADVGIIGFPNAGKSTLISVISSAKPKIADYPFTTLIPNLGIVRIDNRKSFVVADIPGLIEGAHYGKGLGVQFLRHIERTKVLVVLIDSQSEEPQEDLKILLNELKSYNPEIIKKKKIICLSKIDTVDDKKRIALKKIKFKDNAHKLLISSVTNESIDKLKYMIWDFLNSVD
jgi:GTP-binding protein